MILAQKGGNTTAIEGDFLVLRENAGAGLAVHEREVSVCILDYRIIGFGRLRKENARKDGMLICQSIGMQKR